MDYQGSTSRQRDLDRERDRQRIADHHRPPYRDGGLDHYYHKRGYQEDGDRFARSPSMSSSAWSSQLPPPPSMDHSRPTESRSHHHPSSRLPPPAHYDPPAHRASPTGDSSRRHTSRDDVIQVGGGRSTSSRYLTSSNGGNVHHGPSNGGQTYYSSTSPSGVTPTTNNTSPSSLSTTSSSSSSLRTPPDLVSIHGSVPSGKKYQGSIVYGLTGRRYLSIQEIDQRLELLASLDGVTIDTHLPSEPSLTHSSEAKARQRAIPTDDGGCDKIAKKAIRKEDRQNGISSSKMASAVTSKASSSTLPQLDSTSTTTTLKKRKSSITRDEMTGSDTESQRRKKHSPPLEATGSTSRRGSVTKKTEEGASAPRKEAKKKVKTRKESTSTRDYDTPSPSPPPEESRRGNGQASSSKPPAFSSFPAPKLEPRTWSKEDFTRIANAYQARGRALKHSGDNRVRSAPPSSSSSARAAIQRVANYEQTEAILLYMYAFWCEDHAATASSSSNKVACITANWTSLSGLMHYVCVNHEKAQDRALAGLCRLLEAVVLKHVASHEQKQLNLRLAKIASRSGATSTVDSPPPPSNSAVASNGVNSSHQGHAQTSASPASQASPTTAASSGPSEGDHTSINGIGNGNGNAGSSTLPQPQPQPPPPPSSSLPSSSLTSSDLTSQLNDLSTCLSKVIADQERSSRLITLARSSILSPSVLMEEFPSTWNTCLSFGFQMDPVKTFKELNPGKADPSFLNLDGNVDVVKPQSKDHHHQPQQSQQRGEYHLDPSPSSSPSPSLPQTLWSWPIDPGTLPASILVPHLVNFSRALLREAAFRRAVQFAISTGLP